MKNYDFGIYDTYYQRRVLWTTDGTPDYLSDDNDVVEDRYAFVNIPTLLQVSQYTMDEILWDYLLIRVHDPEDTGLID